jgi:MFS family permease
MMTWGLGEGMFIFFQPLYLQELGADPLKIGAILGLVGLAMTLSYLPAGYLSDRIGRRPLLVLAWVLGTLATLTMAFAPSLPIFVAGMVFYGLTSYVTVPLFSYMTAARGRFSVGRILTLNSAFFNLGSILGPILGGVIGEQSGLQANFRYAALIFVFSSGIIFFVRPQPLELSDSSQARFVSKELWHSSYFRYVLLAFFIMIGMYLPQPLSQNFLQNERGVGLTQIGRLIAVRSAGIVILNLILGQLNPRLGFRLTQVCMGLFACLIWLGNSIPFYFAGYLLVGSYITARGFVIAQGRALIKAADMGLAYGMLETAMTLAMVLGPPLAGYLYQIDPETIYSVSLGLVAAGFLANLLLSPLNRLDMTSIEAQETAAHVEAGSMGH